MNCFLLNEEPLTPLVKIFLALILCLLFTLTDERCGHTREPAVRLGELVRYDAHPGEIPQTCSFLIFDGKSLAFSPSVREALQRNRHPAWIEVSQGVHNLEDAEQAVLLRTAQSCRLWLGTTEAFLSGNEQGLDGVMPSNSLLNLTEDRLQIENNAHTYHVAAQTGTCLEPWDEKSPDCRLFAYAYGLFPLLDTLPEQKPVPVKAGDAKEGRFAGPGEQHIYAVDIPQSGSLVVEYTIDGPPSAVDLRIVDADAETIGRGSAQFSAPQTARVVLDYQGTGPADYAVGFLFSREQDLSCRLSAIREKTDSPVALTLLIKNETDHVVVAPEPGAGTVTWKHDGQIMAGAHPGQGMDFRTYAPREEFIYRLDIILPDTVQRIQAVYGENTAPLCRSESTIDGVDNDKTFR